MTTATATPADLIAEAQAICDEVEADRSAIGAQDRILVGRQLSYAVGEILACGLLADGYLDWDDLGGDDEDPPMTAAARALDAARGAQNRLAEAQRRAENIAAKRGITGGLAA